MWENRLIVNNGCSSAKPGKRYHPAHSLGLTLIELLIALAIFAVLSAITHGAIRAALEARQRIEAESNRLGDLQRAMLVIERDVVQMVGRRIRDENGEALPALKSPGNGFRLLEFTRTGWNNPTRANRSHLT